MPLFVVNKRDFASADATRAFLPIWLNRRIAHCRSHCLFRQPPPPTAQPSRWFAAAPIACFAVSSASLHPSIWLHRRITRYRSYCLFRQPPPPRLLPPLGAASATEPQAAFGYGTSLHPSIWLNRRAGSLPLPSLVSPASSTPPFSATGGGGVPEPLAAHRLRSPGPSDASLFQHEMT